ncbi:Mediator of RNA polymerase II transcription subunit 10 [Strongyloides ratti]|uniref:Mediator of RNA polymerase II transcription subunit 10 n=1 Tax=Strongyloides ratti TaxID=34506 RepID=A0A090LH82_STRRB|nr:Mediator of RNA polymerase II transcription subunit 10 [Strongyloides ratti]CEF66835.1 Mediator of RNA polymerase II transcription subunit 10 [Strongyloides ratti]
MSSGERYMPSIARDCDEFKKDYERCFVTEFFPRFVDPNNTRVDHLNPCEHLHNIYKQCIEIYLTKNKVHDIDFNDLQDDYWNDALDEAGNKIPSPELREENDEDEGKKKSGAQSNNLRFVDPEDAKFEKLELDLGRFIEDVRQLGVTASDPGENANEIIRAKLRKIASGLQNMNDISSQFMNHQIPIKIFDFVDDMKNPNAYSKAVFEETDAKNSEVNGKIEQYKKYKAKVLAKWSEEMPDAALQYMVMRKESEGDKEMPFL